MLFFVFFLCSLLFATFPYRVSHIWCSSLLTTHRVEYRRFVALPLSRSRSLLLALFHSLALSSPPLPATLTSYAILLHSTNINLCIIFSMTNQSKPVRKFNRVIYFCLLVPNCFDVILQIFYTYTPFSRNTMPMFPIPYHFRLNLFFIGKVELLWIWKHHEYWQFLELTLPQTSATDHIAFCFEIIITSVTTNLAFYLIPNSNKSTVEIPL